MCACGDVMLRICENTSDIKLATEYSLLASYELIFVTIVTSVTRNESLY